MKNEITKIEKLVDILTASDDDFEENGWTEIDELDASESAIKGLLAWQCLFDYLQDSDDATITVNEILVIYNSIMYELFDSDVFE